MHKVVVVLAAATTLAACHFKPDLPPANEVVFSLAQPVAYDSMGQCVGAHARDLWGASVETYPRNRSVRVVVPRGAEFLVRPEAGGSGSSVDLVYFPAADSGDPQTFNLEGRRIVSACRSLPAPPPSPYRTL